MKVCEVIEYENKGSPLFEMANFGKRTLNLPRNIWINQIADDGASITHNEMRIKVQIDGGDRFNIKNSIEITFFDDDLKVIAKNPRDIAGMTKEINIIKNWITKNRNHIISYMMGEIDGDMLKQKCK